MAYSCFVFTGLANVVKMFCADFVSLAQNVSLMSNISLTQNVCKIPSKHNTITITDNAGLMLGQRRRLWPMIKSALWLCIVIHH